MNAFVKHIWIISLTALTACSDDVFEPPPPMYNLCETSDDCSERTPVCRTLDLLGTGTTASVCTAVCSESAAICPQNRRDGSIPLFHCLGIDDQGKIDENSTERLCVSACTQYEFFEEFGCYLTGRREESVCALIPYDSYGPKFVCLEPGTPPPPPIIPVYHTCWGGFDWDGPAVECSELTPFCRRIVPWPGSSAIEFCTRPCFEDSDCPTTGGEDAQISGRCLGVNAQGVIDPASTNRLCFQGCTEAEEDCFVGTTHPTIAPRWSRCTAVVPDDPDYTQGLVCF